MVWGEPLTGRRTVRVSAQPTGLHGAEHLRLLVDEDAPEAAQIRLGVDQLKPHAPAGLYARFAPEAARCLARPLAWPATPEPGAWRNRAEGAWSVRARQCLSRRLAAVQTLQREVAAWDDRRHQAQVTLVWRFTTADARIKLTRLYPVCKEQNVQKAA